MNSLLIITPQKTFMFSLVYHKSFITEPFSGIELATLVNWIERVIHKPTEKYFDKNIFDPAKIWFGLFFTACQLLKCYSI